MDQLIKAELLEPFPSPDTTDGLKSKSSAACQYEGDNIYVAFHQEDGTIHMLVFLGKKLLGPTHSRIVKWSDLDGGELKSLQFDRTGQRLAAVSDSCLHIIPFFQLLTKPSNNAEVYDIPLPKIHGVVTCCVWWQTASHEDVVIIGSDRGEILFIDTEKSKCVQRTHVTGHVTRLEIVADDRQHVTYLLISARSSLQWKLTLDILDLDLHKTKSAVEMLGCGYGYYGGNTYVRSILHHKFVDSDEEFSPIRFTNIPIAYTLRYQYAKGCHLLSAVDIRDNTLKIYDSSGQRHPLYEYILPFWTEWIIYTDKLIFCVQDDSKLVILSNQLSEKHADNTQHEDSHVLFSYDLFEGERVLYVTSIMLSTSWYKDLALASSQFDCKATTHSILDGCLLLTNYRLLLFRPRLSPEQLFLNWCTDSIDMQRLESLALVTHIDLLHLLLQSADYHLSKGEFKLAMEALDNSKCSAWSRVQLLYKYRLWSEVLNSGNQALSGEPTTPITSSSKSAISNCMLESYLELIKQSSNHKLINQFSKFLIANQHYSLDKATQLISETEFIHLLVQTALSRKFIQSVLEYLYAKDKLTNEVLTEFIYHQDLIHALDTVAEGEIVHMLNIGNLYKYMLHTEEPRPSLLPRLTSQLDQLGTEALYELAQCYHPRSYRVTKLLKAEKSRHHTATVFDATNKIVNEMDMETEDSESFESVCSVLYLFFVRLVLELSSRSDHECLLIQDVIAALPNVSTNKNKSKHLLQLRSKPLACNSTNVYSLSSSGVFFWGSKIKLDHVKIDDRVKVSTPSIISYPNINTLSVKAISCGEQHVMLLTDSGHLYGWGESRYGQVGVGSFERVTHPSKVHVECVDVICGRYHTLAINKRGRLYSWGWGVYGQLGLGNVESECKPKLVSSLNRQFIISAAAGHSHSVALSKQGQVYVFGSNHFGQCGSSCYSDKVTSPQVLELNHPVRLIASRYFHTVALLENGSLLVWGIHPFLLRKKVQTSQKYRGDDSIPQAAVSSISQSVRCINTDKIDSSISQISCGASHALLLSSSGRVYIWEESEDFHLTVKSPDEHIQQSHDMAQPISDNLTSIVYISCDNKYNLALKANGAVLSWGKNDNGQLGLALRNIRYVQEPAKVKISQAYHKASSIQDYTVKYVETASSEPYEETSQDQLEATQYDLACDSLSLGSLTSIPLFPLTQALELSLTHKVNSAVVVFSCLAMKWSNACFYHLKSISSCQKHLPNYIEQVVDVVSFYLEKASAQAEQDPNYELLTILYRICQFWLAKSFPVRNALESIFTHHLELIAPALSQILLQPSKQTALPDRFASSFSPNFLIQLTRFSMLKTNNPNLSTNTATLQANAALLEEAKSPAVKGNTYISLSSSQLAQMGFTSEQTEEKQEAIVFTCGHHYTKENFENKMLRGFSSRFANKIPVTSNILINMYRKDKVPLACPQCVSSTIRTLAG